MKDFGVRGQGGNKHSAFRIGRAFEGVKTGGSSMRKKLLGRIHFWNRLHLQVGVRSRVIDKAADDSSRYCTTERHTIKILLAMRHNSTSLISNDPGYIKGVEKYCNA